MSANTCSVGQKSRKKRKNYAARFCLARRNLRKKYVWCHSKYAPDLVKNSSLEAQLKINAPSATLLRCLLK